MRRKRHIILEFYMMLIHIEVVCCLKVHNFLCFRGKTVFLQIPVSSWFNEAKDNLQIWGSASFQLLSALNLVWFTITFCLWLLPLKSEAWGKLKLLLVWGQFWYICQIFQVLEKLKRKINMIKFKRNEINCFDELWEILSQNAIWCC